MEWLSEKGPLEGLGHGAIQIDDEIEHLVAEIVERATVDRRQRCERNALRLGHGPAVTAGT